jgi:NAD+ kinase
MSQFSRIGVMGKPNNPEVKSTIHSLIEYLKELNLEVWVDKACAPIVKGTKVSTCAEHKLAPRCDLIVVVGGDGSLLKAARTIVDEQVPVIGVNRGRKGFLTDISPQALADELCPILEGEYIEERRFLLHASIVRNGKAVFENIGLNDTVLYSGHVARMIEFEASIDGVLVYRQRSDGLIIATPTGSTAYALSGGGPILHPSLSALVLVPMHPHTLSSRPIVVSDDKKISLHVVKDNEFKPRFSFDGQIHTDVSPGDTIHIEKYRKTLRLLHPKSYDYYQTLRGKLGWNIYQ